MSVQVEKYVLNINGYQVEYQSSGSGFPLVLIHTRHSYAKYFLSSLPEGKSYRVITIDIPGYYSVGGKKPVTTVDQFLDLLEALFIKLNLKEVDLLGECLGAIIVLQFAQKYPRRIRKLIAVSPPLRVFGNKFRKTFGPFFFLLRRSRLAGRTAKAFVRFNLWRGVAAYFGGYRGFWDLFHQETLRVSKINFDPRVFWGILANLFEIDIKNIVGGVKTETLFILGSKDLMTKKKEILKYCKEKKNLNLKIIAGANHALVSSHTKQFNSLVTKFLLESKRGQRVEQEE